MSSEPVDVEAAIERTTRFGAGEPIYAIVPALSDLRYDVAVALRHLATRADTAEKALAEAREALRPFAEAADDLDETHRDASPVWEAPAAISITAGDLRRARTLSSPDEGVGK